MLASPVLTVAVSTGPISASLIEACKLIGIDPHANLTDVTTKIVNNHPNSQFDDLLP